MRITKDKIAKSLCLLICFILFVLLEEGSSNYVYAENIIEEEQEKNHSDINLYDTDSNIEKNQEYFESIQILQKEYQDMVNMDTIIPISFVDSKNIDYSDSKKFIFAIYTPKTAQLFYTYKNIYNKKGELKKQGVSIVNIVTGKEYSVSAMQITSHTDNAILYHCTAYLDGTEEFTNLQLAYNLINFHDILSVILKPIPELTKNDAFFEKFGYPTFVLNENKYILLAGNDIFHNNASMKPNDWELNKYSDAYAQYILLPLDNDEFFIKSKDIKIKVGDVVYPPIKESFREISLVPLREGYLYYSPEGIAYATFGILYEYLSSYYNEDTLTTLISSEDFIKYNEENIVNINNRRIDECYYDDIEHYVKIITKECEIDYSRVY